MNLACFRGERKLGESPWEELQVSQIAARRDTKIGKEEERTVRQRTREQRLVEAFAARRRRNPRKERGGKHYCLSPSLGGGFVLGMLRPTRAAVAATTSCWLLPESGK